MKVGAPYGNRNAEKWTFKKAIQLFKDAIDLSNEKETSFLKVGERAVEVKNYKYDFIGEISGELGTYHKMITHHLPNRFKSLERVKNQLLSNLERNCYSNGKKGAIKEASAIMNLKSNYHWTDRNDITTKDKEINQKDVSEYTTEELIKRAESIRYINGTP